MLFIFVGGGIYHLVVFPCQGGFSLGLESKHQLRHTHVNFVHTYIDYMELIVMYVSLID